MKVWAAQHRSWPWTDQVYWRPLGRSSRHDKKVIPIWRETGGGSSLSRASAANFRTALWRMAQKSPRDCTEIGTDNFSHWRRRISISSNKSYIIENALANPQTNPQRLEDGPRPRFVIPRDLVSDRTTQWPWCRPIQPSSRSGWIWPIWSACSRKNGRKKCLKVFWHIPKWGVEDWISHEVCHSRLIAIPRWIKRWTRILPKSS